MTTGLLIGIGETRQERLEALLVLRELHERTGICRNSSFRTSAPNPARGWRAAAEPALEEQLWTIAVARLLFGPEMSIQAPPNLQPNELGASWFAPASTIGAASRR